MIEVTQHQFLKGLLIPPGVLENSCLEGKFEKEVEVSAANRSIAENALPAGGGDLDGV